MHKDYRYLFDGKTYTVSAGRWQAKVTDVAQMQGRADLFDPTDVDPEDMFYDWLCFHIKFKNEENIELNLKLYVSVPLATVEKYGEWLVEDELRLEIELWLGNPERSAELIIGPLGIWMR